MVYNLVNWVFYGARLSPAKLEQIFIPEAPFVHHDMIASGTLQLFQVAAANMTYGKSQRACFAASF